MCQHHIFTVLHEFMSSKVSSDLAPGLVIFQSPKKPIAMRAILDLSAGEAADAVVLCPTSGLLRRHAGGPVSAEGYLHEAAGQRFFDRFEASDVEAHDDSNDDCESIADDQDASPRKKKKEGNLSSTGILKLSSILEGVKLYPLMRVEEGASQDDIKKAYRALALESHPDKLGAASEAESKKIQENFIKIQEAYEILSDPEKRKLYDSSLPFDDKIPKFKPEDGEDFYKVFGGAFQRNARFAQKKPVPEIGNGETDMKDVKRFYDYWYSFQSWRDPLAMAQANDEELADLEDAECREEKRWMMRENARIGRKYKQAEQERVRRLVEKAESFDPRILAEKEQKRAAREADLQAKHEERTALQRAKEAEELRLREIEETKLAAEAANRQAERAIKDAEKAEVKKLRQRLRSFHPSVKETVELSQLNEICLQLEKPALEELGNTVDAALNQRKSKSKTSTDCAKNATKLIHAAIESLGMKPVVPQKEEDTDSTRSGDVSEGPSSESKLENPAVLKERREAEERRRVEREAQDAVKEQERAQQAIKATEERKKREEQRRKDDAAADAKRKQLEKKEREKAKKAEEKKAKTEQEELAKREQQRADAKLQQELQAQRDREASMNTLKQRETEAEAELFDADRLERLDQLDAMSEEEIQTELTSSYAADASLRGALHLLTKADIDEEQSRDCLQVLLFRVSPVWQLGLAPPADIKAVTSTRNRVKKARLLLQKVALSWFQALDAPAKSDLKQVTVWQRGMVEGLYEWPVWTQEVRMEELKERPDFVAAKEVVEEQVIDQTPTSNKGGKKKGAADKADEEEDLDSLFAEFGVTITEKKPKKKSKK